MTKEELKPGVFAAVDPRSGPKREGLTPSEAGCGVLAARRNARRLLRDAVCLLENGRYASAITMAVLAQEECAKYWTIGLIAACCFPVPPLLRPWQAPLLKKLWLEFTHHESKNRTLVDLSRKIGSHSPKVREMLLRVDVARVAKDMVTTRERTTYVDCVQGPERWSVPDRVASRTLAVDMVRAAAKRIAESLGPADTLDMFGGAAPRIAGLGNEKHLAALEAWSKSAEGLQLSELDRKEQEEWRAEVAFALAAFEKRGTGPE